MRFASVLLLSALRLSAQTPDIPQELRPPDGLVLSERLQAEGRQVYVCQNAANAYTWKLKAPEATLVDVSGKPAGRHFAGPTWEAADGSRVSGKMVATVASPDPDSIPWLLVRAESHSGTGIMEKVQSIQRIETKGGLPPSAGCSATTGNTETSVRYEASYLFYSMPGGNESR